MRRHEPAPRRAGRVPVWLSLAILVAGAGLASRLLLRAADAQGVTTIDSRRAALSGPEWVPPAWEEWIAVRLAELGPAASLKRSSIRALVAELESMPQIARVVATRVVWPDGLEVELELRRPVACVRTGDEFLTVSADGVLLPGYWASPPDTGRGFLPVIGPNDRAFDTWAPGHVLVEDRHRDALSVAASMLAHLSADHLTRLGPVLIDASHADEASIGEPGTRLYLESRRLALFGRPPSHQAPGELPAELKWAHLARALDRLAAGPEYDWDLIDLRWDRAPIRGRSADE